MYNTEKWDRYFLRIAKDVSEQSKDPSSKIGAVVVDDKGRIVGTGYNGFPRGVLDSEARLNDRELKYKMVIHAEVNACITAGEKCEGATLYVYPGWGRPCMCENCAKHVIQFGIKRVVGLLRPVDEEKLARWKDSLATAQIMCDEAGLLTEVYNESIS